MPNQSHSGTHVSPWHRCDRCGVDYRLSDLQWQMGLLVCPDDFDNPIAWTRTTMIQEVLSDGEPEGQIADKLQGHDNEPEPPQS